MVSKAQLAASRGLRTRLRLPVDDALTGVGGVSRLEAEVAVSAALEAAHTSHLSCLRAVSGRRYALGAIHHVLGSPLPRIDWNSCVGNDDEGLNALFESSGGFDDAWRAAAATLKQRLAIALFVDEERGGHSISKRAGAAPGLLPRDSGSIFSVQQWATCCPTTEVAAARRHVRWRPQTSRTCRRCGRRGRPAKSWRDAGAAAKMFRGLSTSIARR